MQQDSKPELRISGHTPDNIALEANTVLNLNEWYHIAGTYDGNEAKIYINGVLDGTRFFNRNLLASPGGKLYIGIDRDGSTDYNQALNGCLDELRIWSEVRTQSQISENMNTELSGNEAGLIAYYNMEQTGNNILTDVSNHQNDGVLEGSSGQNDKPIFSSTIVNLTTTQTEFTICQGERVSFEVDGAIDYEWWPGNLLNNPNISNPTSLELSENTQFGVVGTIPCGLVPDTINFFVEVLEEYSENLTLTSCNGESVVYNNVELNVGDSEVFTFMAGNGCDSTINVSVIEGNTIEKEESRVICEGDSILIDGSYQSTPGIYTELLPNSLGCDTLLVISLSVTSPSSILIEEMPSCFDIPTGSATATVIGGTAPFAYIWGPDSISTNGPTISSLPPGDYTVTVIDFAGCSISESFTISSIDSLSIDLDLDISHVSCYGKEDGSLFINSSITSLQYSLDDSTNFTDNQFFENISPGLHTLYYQNPSGCIGKQEFSIEEGDEFFVVLPNDTSIQLGCPYTIEPSIVGGSPPFLYSWVANDSLDCSNCFAQEITPRFDNRYVLTVTDSLGCESSDDIFIGVASERSVYIPNAFSPNGDGINDQFCIYANKEVDLVLEFRIFNRWGAFIFERKNFSPNDDTYCWDGYFKGELMQNQVFVYYAKIRFLDGAVEIFTGDVTIVK